MKLKNRRSILTDFKTVQVIGESRVRLASQRNYFFDCMAMTDFIPPKQGVNFQFSAGFYL